MYTVVHERPNGETTKFEYESYDKADAKLERFEKLERKSCSIIIMTEPELFYAVTPHGLWHKYELIY